MLTIIPLRQIFCQGKTMLYSNFCRLKHLIPSGKSSFVANIYDIITMTVAIFYRTKKTDVKLKVSRQFFVSCCQNKFLLPRL